MKKKKVINMVLIGMTVFGSILLPKTVFAETTEQNLCSYIPSEEDEDAPVVTEEASQVNDLYWANTLPEKYDPISSDCGYTLPDLRDQSPYGGCWAFSGAALQELSLQKQGYGSWDLSELQMIYYTYNSVVDPLKGTAEDSVTTTRNYLDVGGNYSYMISSLINWRGATEESTVPYTQAGQVLRDGLSDEYAYNEDVCHLQNAYKVNIRENQDQIKQMIMNMGGVGISYYDSSAYYDKNNNSYYCKSDITVNHAVTIVGWDDNFDKNKFVSPASENGAWLIRNSWTSGAASLEHNGYFWISYDDASIADTAYVMVAEPANTYDHNYQYDGALRVGYESLNQTDTLTAANVFQISDVSDKQELKAASFWTNTAQTDYTVQIYVNPTDTLNPESGQLVSTTQGTTEFAGYYTIPLSQSVQLNAGDKVSVVVTLSKSGATSSPELAYEIGNTEGGNYPFYGVAGAKTGQSFLKSGSSWIDYGKQKNRNLRIKAFTVDIVSYENASGGIYIANQDHTGITAGMVTENFSTKSNTEYRWLYYEDDTWKVAQDWQKGNEWLNWTPEHFGDFVIVGQARDAKHPSYMIQADTGFSYHPEIKGKCQMPYTGAGGGFLIGMESYRNNGYSYEMLILDCTLLAQGKDAWTYTTGKCNVDGNAFWTVWQPQYGYYWTLFRVYDSDGKLIDEECYGFQNI